MADIDSTIISNRAASPRVANDPWNDAQIKSTGAGSVEVSTATDIADELRFFRVKSNAVIKQVLLSCDAVAVGGAIDIGVYRTDDDGGAVVDADFFASAQVVTAALVDSNVAHESAVYGIEDKNKPLWEALGLSEDSQVWYDIAGTVTTDMGGAGTLMLEATYVDGGA